ncbi:unnamed protein product, partial [Nesidiocoris tenuis]
MNQFECSWSKNLCFPLQNTWIFFYSSNLTNSDFRRIRVVSKRRRMNEYSMRTLV